MSTISRKIKKEYERASLKVLFGKNPKHRCSMCHKMALYDKENKCVHCSGKYDEQEKKFMEYLKIQNAKRKKESE